MESKAILPVLALVNSFGGFLFGYNTGIIAVAQDGIKDEYDLNDIKVGILTSSLLLGAMIGSGAGGLCCDKIGRKKTAFLTGVVGVIGAVCSSLVPSESYAYGLLCFIRAILGISVGLSSVACPLYVSEMSPPNVRGILSTLFQLFITLGILIAYLIGYAIQETMDDKTKQWKLMLGLGSIPCLILAVLSLLFMPESDQWLKSKSEGEGVGLINNSSGSSSGGWAELFSPRKFKVLALGVVLAICLQFTGINAVFYYAPFIFESAGFGDKKTLMAILLAAWNFGVTIISLFLVDRLGRKPLLLGGLVTIAVGDFVLGLAYLVLSGTSLGWVALVSLLCFVAGFAVGVGATFWVLLSEIFPSDVRDQANGFINILQWGINLILALFFRDMIASIKATATFWIFGAIGIFGLVYMFIFLKETKGRRLDQEDA